MNSGDLHIVCRKSAHTSQGLWRRPDFIRFGCFATALLSVATLFHPPCGRADDADTAAWNLIRSAGAELSREEIAELVRLDVELSERSDAVAAQMRGAILEVLAVSGETTGIEYVRGVFESDVELRDEAACAISLFCLKHRRTPGDWRYLVRSLMVVEGPQAESVLEALLQFRERATKPVWIRQVILVGLRLEAGGMSAADRLLAHWSDREPESVAGSPREQLAEWQSWFREEFPDEADPALPAPPNGAQWTEAGLRGSLLNADLTEHDAVVGEGVYRRANCAKCHRFGSVGEQRAPELTRVRARLQRTQILDAMLYPSLHLNEEYPAATMLLKDGRTFAGTVAGHSPTQIALVTLDGTEHRFEKEDVDEVRSSNISGMPSGLLDELSERQILDLFAFLLGARSE